MIRNSLIRIFAVIAAAILNAACADNLGDAEKYGTLDLSSIVVDSSASENTRAVSTDDYILKVWDWKNRLAGQWALSERPADVLLKVGQYRLEVCSPSLVDAGWETPWYVGTAQFAIEENVRKNVGTVVCRLGNVKVTVRYSEELKALLHDDVGVRVSIVDAGLSFLYGELRGGFLKASGETCDLKVEFSGTIDGVYETHTEVVSGVKPGEWERIRIAFEESERRFHIIIFGSEAGQVSGGEDWGVF